jgi:hypothetical protein
VLEYDELDPVTVKVEEQHDGPGRCRDVVAVVAVDDRCAWDALELAGA